MDLKKITKDEVKYLVSILFIGPAGIITLGMANLDINVDFISNIVPLHKIFGFYNYCSEQSHIGLRLSQCLILNNGKSCEIIHVLTN